MTESSHPLCDTCRVREAAYLLTRWLIDEPMRLCPACLAHKAATDPGDVEHIESLSRWHPSQDVTVDPRGLDELREELRHLGDDDTAEDGGDGTC